MLKLPTALNQQFDNLLLNKSFCDKDKSFYKKWLRFYWDFCHKYQHDAFHSGSLPLFLHKLRDKNQSEQQQNQAKHAVSLFFEMHTDSEQPLTRNKNVSIPSQQSANHTKVALSHSEHDNSHSSVVQNSVQQSSYDQYNSNSLTVNHPLEESGTSWVFVFDQLINEIKIRHYSPKTLNSTLSYYSRAT